MRVQIVGPPHTSPLRERNKKLLQGKGKETTSARYKRKGKDTNSQVGQETIEGSKAGSKLWTLDHRCMSASD